MFKLIKTTVSLNNMNLHKFSYNTKTYQIPSPNATECPYLIVELNIYKYNRFIWL